MSLEELFQVIQQSEFQLLLNKYSFILIKKDHEVNDGYHDRYLIEYESNSLKLGFYYEPGGGINVLIGLSSNSFDNDKIEWVGLEYIISFLLNRPIKRGHKHTEKPLQQQLIDDLSIISHDFEPLGDKIIAMFQDKKTVQEWKPKLEQYIKDDTRRRYGIQ